MGFLSGSRERVVAFGNDVLLLVRLFGCLRLAGLGCRDVTLDATDADRFGTGNFDLVAVDAAAVAVAVRFRLLFSLSIFKLAEIGDEDTLRRLANGVMEFGDEFFELWLLLRADLREMDVLLLLLLLILLRLLLFMVLPFVFGEVTAGVNFFNLSIRCVGDFTLSNECRFRVIMLFSLNSATSAFLVRITPESILMRSS